VGSSLFEYKISYFSFAQHLSFIFERIIVFLMGNLNESVDKVMLYEFYLALALGFLYYSMFWNKFHMGNFSCDCFSFWLHVI
jgi:hypothetical protein